MRRPGPAAWAGRVSIRNQRSRWGSCAREGNIALNFRLVQMPPAIREEIAGMARHAAAWLERKTLVARTVTVKVRFPDFTTLTRSQTFRIPTADPRRIAAAAKVLLIP